MNEQLLETLEARWNAMAEAIRALREENGTLTERLRDRDALIAKFEENTRDLSQKNETLEEEKRHVGDRIEALLERFETLEV